VALMPRFGLKGMLVLLAVVALWLSTAAGYTGSYDVRFTIVLLVLVAAGLKAYCSAGRWKCFWLGFFAVLAVFAYGGGDITPRLEWVPGTLRGVIVGENSGAWTSAPPQTPVPPPDDLFGTAQQPAPVELIVDFTAATIQYGFNLIVAAVAGWIGLVIYDQTQKASPR
jgi:hypothetical protein